MSGTNRIELKRLAIGLPKKMEYPIDKELVTAICKDETTEAYLTKDGFRGDGVADLRYHGGPDRAVCMYPYEHYEQWEREFGVSLAPTTFGENATVSNMLERDVHIGDIFQFGEAVIQITQARTPCSTITKRTGLPLLLKRMVETGYTGYLCRVLEEGYVRHDSEITLLKQHPTPISILELNELYYHRKQDVEGIKRVLEVAELAAEWREDLTKRL